MDKNLQRGSTALIVVVILVVIAAVGGYYWFSRNQGGGTLDAEVDDYDDQSVEDMEDDEMMDEEGYDDSASDGDSGSDDGSMMGSPKMTETPFTGADTSGGGMMNQSQVKEFMVSGSSFKFSLAEIRVKKGDKVRIVFKNEGGFHDWVLDEFNARTKQIKAGESETIEFVADKTGTFEYYCSVGNHRQMGMVGKLIVE